MKINAVKFKDKKSFDKNKVKNNVKAVYEPFGIVVFEDDKPVTPDASKVSHVNEVDAGLDQIATGLAILIAKDVEVAIEYLTLKQVEIKEVFASTNTLFVEVPAFAVFNEFYTALMNSKLFISVEPDYIQPFEANAEMTVPQQWHLNLFQAQSAWSLLPANAYGEVAVLDIACDVDHEDLQGAISSTSWNCVFDTADVRPISEYEKHGTPCSGLICATTNNNIGVSSIGNNKLKVQFLHIGMNSTSGGSFMTSDTIVTRAVNKAIENPNCLAISMSWGGTGVYSMFQNALTAAKNTARNGKGICIFASSGNNSSSSVNINPAALPMVHAVGASTVSNTRASFSNYGTKLFAAAPGTSIPTTDRTGAAGYNTTSNYTNFSGTSAACPVMAGCAAAILLANPSLSEQQVTSIIASTAKKTGGYVYDASGRSLELGHGVVDLYGAIIKARDIENPTPPAQLYNIFGTISSPASIAQGEQVTVNYTVQLDKALTVDVTTNVTVSYIHPDGFKSTFYTGSVTFAKGETMKGGVLPYLLPNNKTGVGQFVLHVDSTSSIAETNESDNIVSTSITIIPVVPVTNNDLQVEITGYTWIAPDRVRINSKITNRGTSTVTSYKIKWEFAGSSGVWSRTANMATNQSGSFGNVMYPKAGTTYPQTMRMSVVSVNEQPDNNPSNDVATFVVNQN